MFDDWDIRVQATTLIWIIFGAVSIVTIVADDVASNDVPVIFLAAFAAVLSTAAVWSFASEQMNAMHARNHATQSNDEKQKRGEGDDPRIALLLSLMDEHEKADLKQRLMDELRNDNVELPLSALMDSDGELRLMRK